MEEAKKTSKKKKKKGGIINRLFNGHLLRDERITKNFGREQQICLPAGATHYIEPEKRGKNT